MKNVSLEKKDPVFKQVPGRWEKESDSRLCPRLSTWAWVCHLEQEPST